MAADDGPSWVAVASYPTRPFADFVASALEGHGIPTRVVGDDGGGMLPHVDTLAGGVHVEVPRDDVPAARELLARVPDGPTVSGDRPGVDRRAARWRVAVAAVVAVGLALVVGAAFFGS